MRLTKNAGARNRIWPPAPVVWLLLAFSIVGGRLLERGTSFWQPETLHADWSGTTWLRYPEGAPTAYFRRKVVLDQTPRRAWLYVSATDRFEIWVNGRSRGRIKYPERRSTTTLDLTGHLHKGENLLGIAVYSETVDQDAEMRANLLIINHDGSITRPTEGVWQVERRDLKNSTANESIAWSQPGYDASAWPSAQPITQTARELPPPIAWQDAQLLPSGFWIWNRDSTRTESSFQREFGLDWSHVSTAWLAVAATGVVHVRVNGYPLTSVRNYGRTSALYQIAPFLRRGTNRVVVSVSSDWRDIPYQMNASLIVRSGKRVWDLSSDTHWTADQMPAAVLGTAIASAPPITLSEWQASPAYRIERALHRAAYIFGMFALILALGACYALAVSGRANRDSAWFAYAWPFGICSALLIVLWLAEFDPRLEAVKQLYRLELPIILGLGIGGWLLVFGGWQFARQMRSEEAI